VVPRRWNGYGEETGRRGRGDKIEDTVIMRREEA